MLGSAFVVLRGLCCAIGQYDCRGSSRWQVQRLEALDLQLENDTRVRELGLNLHDLHFKLPDEFRLIPESLSDLLGPFSDQIDRSDGCDIQDWLDGRQFRTTISRMELSRDDWKLVRIENANPRVCKTPEPFHHKLMAAERAQPSKGSPVNSASASAISDGDFRRGRYFVSDARASFLREARLPPTETLAHPHLIPVGFHRITAGSVSRVPEPHTLPLRFLKLRHARIYEKVTRMEAHPSSHRVQMGHLLKFGNHVPWRPAGALLLIMLLVVCSVFASAGEQSCSVDSLRPMRAPMRRTSRSSG